MFAAGAGTVLLWSLWLACLYYVVLDMRSGRFRGYIQVDFWAVAGAGACLVICALLGLVIYRNYVVPRNLSPCEAGARSEEEVLHEIFGLSGDTLAYAKTLKNLHVYFTGADLHCVVQEALAVVNRSTG